MKVGDYIKGQQPGHWPVEGKVVALAGSGPLEYGTVSVQLNPALFVTEQGGTTVEISERWITEVNGQKWNALTDRTFELADLVKILTN